MAHLGTTGMGSNGANIVVSKIRGFIQAVFATPASARVHHRERLEATYQNAIGFYEKSLARNRKVLGEKHPSTAIDYNNLGEAWISLGDFQKAIVNFEEALAIFRGALPKGHPNIRQVEANLAEAKKQQIR